MPRPSTKEKRRQEILDAFEKCVARYGVEGATLERIADEAQLARPLIRHNVGNRDDLIEALMDRFVKNSRRQTERLIEALPQQGKTDTLINLLFHRQRLDDASVLVASALIIAGATDERIALIMRVWVAEFVNCVDKVLLFDNPDQKDTDIRAVATGIVGIYYNYASLRPLGRISDLAKASKLAAQKLANSLNAVS